MRPKRYLVSCYCGCFYGPQMTTEPYELEECGHTWEEWVEDDNVISESATTRCPRCKQETYVVVDSETIIKEEPIE